MSVFAYSPSWEEVKAGPHGRNWSRGYGGRLLSDLLSIACSVCCFYSSQDHLPRGSTAHRVLGPPGDIFSLSSSSQTILAYIKLANISQHLQLLSFKAQWAAVLPVVFTAMEHVPICPSSKSSSSILPSRHLYMPLPHSPTHPLQRPHTNHTHFELFSCSTQLLCIRDLGCFFSARSVFFHYVRSASRVGAI